MACAGHHHSAPGAHSVVVNSGDSVPHLPGVRATLSPEGSRPGLLFGWKCFWNWAALSGAASTLRPYTPCPPPHLLVWLHLPCAHHSGTGSALCYGTEIVPHFPLIVAGPMGFISPPAPLPWPPVLAMCSSMFFLIPFSPVTSTVPSELVFSSSFPLN